MISIILPVWITDNQTAFLTREAIESFEKTGEDYELVIVDNGSTMMGGELAKLADTYIRNKKNLGYPMAVNQGRWIAKGDIYCIANNDIKVSDNIFRVGRLALKDEKTASVHFRMVGYDEVTEYGNEIWPVGKERWCTSSFFLIKREASQDYDEMYGLGGYDDWDIWHRIRHLEGWRTAYTNLAYYQHLDSHTQLQRDPKERRESDKTNKEYFKQKFGDYPENIWNMLYPEQYKLPWRNFP